MNAKDAASVLDYLIKESAIILSREPETIGNEEPLSSLGFDSMSFVELLVAVERRYQIKLMNSPLKAEDVKNLKCLAECVRRTA